MLFYLGVATTHDWHMWFGFSVDILFLTLIPTLSQTLDWLNKTLESAPIWLYSFTWPGTLRLVSCPKTNQVGMGWFQCGTAVLKLKMQSGKKKTSAMWFWRSNYSPETHKAILFFFNWFYCSNSIKKLFFVWRTDINDKAYGHILVEFHGKCYDCGKKKVYVIEFFYPSYRNILDKHVVGL